MDRGVGWVEFSGDFEGVLVIVGDDLADRCVVDVDDFVVHIGLVFARFASELLN